MAVTKMIGTVCMFGRVFIKRAVSKPSMPGIWTSSNTRAKSPFRTCSSASSPDSAVMISAPNGRNRARVAKRFSGRSSTTRMRPGTALAAPGAKPGRLVSKTLMTQAP